MNDLNEVDRAIMLIKTLDPGATVGYSEYTRQWYVQSGIEISDGVMTTGSAVHTVSPALAVIQLLEKLQSVEAPEVILTNGLRETRHEWRWNGVAWAIVE